MSAFVSSASVRHATVLLASAALVSAGSRKFTVANKCSYTVWPAIFTGAGTAYPDVENGWEAAAGSSRDFTVPDTWQAGRIWGRTQCSFDGSGAGSCLTGNCNGGLVCNQADGYGAAPASLAEFTFGQGTTGVDWYDVSIVDGTNVPIMIALSNSCHEADCSENLNTNCPADLQGPLLDNGEISSCKSACVANLDGNPANSANCCTGDYSSRDACTTSTVQDYSYFKTGCPNSYAYAFDEASGTAMWGCDTNANGVPDYTITFCPNGDDGNGFSSTTSAAASTTTIVSSSTAAPSTTDTPSSTSAPSTTVAASETESSSSTTQTTAVPETGSESASTTVSGSSSTASSTACSQSKKMRRQLKDAVVARTPERLVRWTRSVFHP